jgi:hypothetical protein
MSFPIPAEGHAIVILNHHGRLYAADLVARKMEWRARDAYYGDTYLPPTGMYQRGDDLTIDGWIDSMAVYDPTTGQTEPEPAGLPPARKQLEAP